MKLVVSEFISLDGVVQAPGGPQEDTDGGFAHGGWSMPYFDPATMGAFISGALDATEALLFGRRTWQTMAAAWPERAGDPFADRMNSIRKYVVSSTLAHDDLTWHNSQLVDSSDLVGAVQRLRERDGGDLQVMGSPTLASALVANDFVDEYRMMIEPVILGGGKRIFGDDGRFASLELVSSEATPTGVQLCVFRRLRDGDGGPASPPSA